MAHPDDIVYAPADRPVCEVQPNPGVDVWWPGEVRALFRRETGRDINVNWTEHLPPMTYSRTLLSAQVRKPLRDDKNWARPHQIDHDTEDMHNDDPRRSHRR